LAKPGISQPGKANDFSTTFLKHWLNSFYDNINLRELPTGRDPARPLFVSAPMVSGLTRLSTESL
jgi:hypothetical protein